MEPTSVVLVLLKRSKTDPAVRVTLSKVELPPDWSEAPVTLLSVPPVTTAAANKTCEPAVSAVMLPPVLAKLPA